MVPSLAVTNLPHLIGSYSTCRACEHVRDELCLEGLQIVLRGIQYLLSCVEDIVGHLAAAMLTQHEQRQHPVGCAATCLKSGTGSVDVLQDKAVPQLFIVCSGSMVRGGWQPARSTCKAPSSCTCIHGRIAGVSLGL